MAKYILNKSQINRLLDGKFVIDGQGNKFIASDEVKETFQKMEKYQLYEKMNVILENGKLSIEKIH